MESLKDESKFFTSKECRLSVVELAQWPDADRDSRVVFITRGIREKQVTDLIAACKALGYTASE